MATSTTPKEPSKSFEERLEPWLNQAEYIIVLMLVIMAWTAGWVNLLGYESTGDSVIFGRYSLPFFGLIVVYSLGFVFWLWLMISLRALDGFKRVIALFQEHPLAFAFMWVVIAGFIGLMRNGSFWRYDFSEVWVRFALLEVGLLVIALLFSVLVLLAKPFPESHFHTWRKVVLGMLGVLVLAEGALQVMAATNNLPFDNTTGVTVPYGRIYQDEQGLGNSNTNRYGWYYPEFSMGNETRRIILSGDTFVEALQIPTSAHMGLQLEAQLDEQMPSAVMAQGLMGYGTTQFLNPILSTYIWEPLEPDEIVVFFHLVNDFQVYFGDTVDTFDTIPQVQVNSDGQPEIVNQGVWHRLAHVVILGHEPADPLRTIVSNSLLLNLLGGETIGQIFKLDRPKLPLNIEQTTQDQPFGPATFMFQAGGGEQADQSVAVVAAQLTRFVDYMAERDIQVRLVTIPYFPQAFYTAESEPDDWRNLMGEYDLLRPEQALREVAAEHDVPFLGMTQYMQAQGLTPAEIQALYFNEGNGHLTEVGHAYFAQAIYDCFYASNGDIDPTFCTGIES